MPMLAAHPASGAGKSQQASFSEYLRRDTIRRGAQGGADGDLTAAARRMLTEQRSDVDADQHHEQERCPQQYRQLLADHAEEATLEMRGVPQVPDPNAHVARPGC